MENRLRPVALVVCLLAVLVVSWATLAKTQGPSQNPIQTPTQPEAAERETPPAQEAGAQPELHRAAQAGDLELLRSRLRQGMNPDERDKAMRTPLMDAVKSDRVEAVRLLIDSGADVNAASDSGRTPLIEAAEFGRIDSARLLIASGADINTSQRGWGTPLEAAERAGHNELAATLRRSGARSSGRSVGDTVCVRPWQGDGYCGVVEEVNKTSFRLRVTEIIGCEGGCQARAECSASRPVGGTDGIKVGDEITTVSWCLTHTGGAAMKTRKHLSLRLAEPIRSMCLLAAVAIVVAGAYLLPRALAQSQSGFQYNGIVHVSWWFDEYDSAAGGTSRAALRDTGSNWMGLLVTWYQQDASSNVIARHPDPNKDHTDARIRTAIRDAHSRGLQVMLKPHVDALNGQWRGDFNPSNPAAWFQSYTQFILHYAQIAQEEGVELYCMGTEFKTISGSANRDRWVAVINAINGVYGGPLTYAANATFPADEFTSVSFWDQIDIIGLDGYFTLTDQNNPTLAQLISAWTSNRFGENIVAAVQNFANSRQKPVIFTEIGYKSTDGTNREPWNFGLSGAVDTAEQRDCYEAAFTVWSQQSSWMRGFFWWAWPVPPPAANDGDYNPRSKPAETVLRTWQGPGGNPNFTLSASPTSLTVNRGASGASMITITRSGGFTNAVSLSATGLPSGVTATFNPASTTGGSSALTLAASSTAATGTVNVTINGSGGGLSRGATLSLTVNAPPQPDFTLSASPSNLTINRGASGASTITITRTGGFTNAVALSASGLPSGVTATFNPTSATGGSSALTLAASSTAATGMTSVTINGSGGGLTRSTTLVLTVNAPPAPNFTLSASPASLTVNRGASGASTITITRTGGFTSAVALSATGLPSGVTATFNPPSATGTSSTLTLAASSAATTGPVNVTVSGTGGGLTRAITLSLTVNADTGTGGVTVTPAVTANGPWFNEQVIRLDNTANLTALSVTITIQRTTGVGFNGQYNTVGGQILQSNTVAATTITYQFALAAGQALGTGANRAFAAQMSGSGTTHPTAGDTWVVTYTTGGVTYTQTGHF